MNADDIAALKGLLIHRGWKVFIEELLIPKFETEYRKLRNSRKSDVNYSKACGFLDGLDWVREAAQQMIDESEPESQ